MRRIIPDNHHFVQGIEDSIDQAILKWRGSDGGNIRPADKSNIDPVSRLSMT